MRMVPSDVEFHIEFDFNTPWAIGGQIRGVMKVLEVRGKHNFLKMKNGYCCVVFRRKCARQTDVLQFDTPKCSSATAAKPAVKVTQRPT